MVNFLGERLNSGDDDVMLLGEFAKTAAELLDFILDFLLPACQGQQILCLFRNIHHD